MIKSRQPARDSERKGILHDPPVEREQPRREDEDQGKQADSLVPTEDAGSKFHEMAEEHASKG